MRSVSKIACLVVVCLSSFPGYTQTTASAPNSDGTYQQLRNITLGSETVSVNNLTLKRDAATFHLRSGSICFVSPVQGKVTGAVFVGDGNMILEPPLPIERGMLKLLTKDSGFSEDFSQLVLRFTDSTYDEIKKAGATQGAPCDPGLLKDNQNTLRHDRMVKGDVNLDARILQDVLSPEPGGLFVAFIHGKRYNGKERYYVDPHGAPDVSPEEVNFSTYDENKYGIWSAFHYSDEYKNGKANGTQKNGVIHIEAHKLDTTIEKNANLIGKATTTFVALANGVRVVPFDLFPTLRVQSVVDVSGQPLSFIQEDKNENADFSVILPKPLASGEKYTITTTYAGKEAVENKGGGNYFPIARHNWYPNSDEYATFEMTFRIPKGMKIAAAGDLISDTTEGNQNVTVWKSVGAQTLAGFNFGRFKMEEVKLQKPEYLVQSYANEEPPDEIKSLLHTVEDDAPSMEHHASGAVLGNMSTVPMIKKALAEGQVSIQLYTDYFGPLPFKRLAMSQQTECAAGQSWPALVWMPMCAFYDTTIRHQFGFGEDRGFWRSVGPHEVAHQWWGHQVGWTSYRDQWMSEGFADFSASLFIQLVEKNRGKYIQFWNDERELILERNKEGFRAIDAGPLTLGYRLSNDRAGSDIYRRLIYPKGAYILHMIRMMMWNAKTGDQQFKETMRDFVATYAGKPATTEDFKAIVEKHMNQDMLALTDGSNSMDWFFNEYVYGMALPTYQFEYSFDTGSDGGAVFNFKLTQSGVNENFRMLVPVYLELNDGRVVSLGRIRIIGNNVVAQKVPLPGFMGKPKRALINYNDDVLASSN